MPKKLVDLDVVAVAGVDKAANKRKFLVVKRANDAPTLRERLAKLFKAGDAEMSKSFDQALDSSNMEDQWWRLNDALRTSIRSIIKSDAEDKAALIRESVGQYAEAIVGLVTRMGQAVGGESMQKMHEALTKLADACESDSEPWNRALERVEECAKAWREELKKGDDASMATTGTQNVDLDAILKDASEEVKAAVKAAFAKQEEKLTELQQKVDDLSKRDGDGNTDDINKADLPEAVRKRLEDLEKQAQEAERIAKAEREARVKAEIKKRAEELADVGEVEKIAEAIFKAQTEVSVEFANQLEELFKTANKRIAEGKLFREFGGNGSPVHHDDPSAEFAELVAKRETEEGIPYHEAARKVAEERPDLVEAYKREVPVGQQ